MLFQCNGFPKVMLQTAAISVIRISKVTLQTAVFVHDCPVTRRSFSRLVWYVPQRLCCAGASVRTRISGGPTCSPFVFVEMWGVVCDALVLGFVMPLILLLTLLSHPKYYEYLFILIYSRLSFFLPSIFYIFCTWDFFYLLCYELGLSIGS